MTIPHYVNEHTSEIRAIKPGWYGIESNGMLSSGLFSNQGECLTGITEARSNFRACRRRPLSVPSVEASTSGRALA
jgi:hypothetical protein